MASRKVHMRRVHRQIERTPAQVAEEREVRERFSRERPGLEDLIASGEYDRPVRHGQVLNLLGFLGDLKAERLQQGLTLAAIAEVTGIDQPALSRLESGKNLNPKLATIWKYADALGVLVALDAVGPPVVGPGLADEETRENAGEKARKKRPARRP